MIPLILTGFMASGKTTVGREASFLLRFPFIDSDESCAQETGLMPADYLRRFGEEAFRRWENFFLRQLFSEKNIQKKTPFIFSAGGGMIMDPFNRNLLLQNGFVVWLDLPLGLAVTRLGNRSNRPLLPNPFSIAALRSLYSDRRNAYSKAHCRIVNSFEPPKKVAMDVVRKYKDRQCIRNF